ncbi:phospho-sugar mutase [Anaerophilus nitritogenes]|uniref:phospho-sugar mutase n=1 Tax=Anaerophilus nitritogenes TaxID=2498136 RepID=UPI00101C52F0|nr:phospho-sugar mutase [Anaerophilus nitritogenes]
MKYKNLYNEWINHPYFDEDTKLELKNIENNEKEIEDRFYKDLEFGTGGLRGVIGAGTNRINKYTVRKATQGLANYLLENIENAQEKGVVIAYDSRHESDVFAREAALVLSANEIKAYLFEDLRPTPELSFAVRYLHCAAGIVITASHNPSEYNGYKVYGEDGGQIVPSMAECIIEEIQKIENYEDVSYISDEEAKSKGLLFIIGEEVDKAYIEKVKELSLRKDMIRNSGKKLKIIYTPLHGTGNKLVRRVLNELGFEVAVVKKQENPDPNFSTVKSPNPEENEAFTLALEMAKEYETDVILGTDPDCDRVGLVVKNDQDEYEVLTGNQTGALLVEYVLSTMKEKKVLPKNGVLIKTIVTSKLGEEIAKSFGIDTTDTLTGFKFIGEKIKEFEEKEDREFLFGYEESYGYLAGTFVRDKDAVIASMLICEMTSYYKSKGITLYEALKEIYKKYGYYEEELVSMTLKGKEGLEKIKEILKYFRENTPKSIENQRVKWFRDYKNAVAMNFITGDMEKINLPTSDVLHFTLEDESWFCIRPSGTEPKIKIYFSVKGNSMKSAKDNLKMIKDHVIKMISNS